MDDAAKVNQIVERLGAERAHACRVFIYYGIHYGYEACCIAEFCEDISAGRLPPERAKSQGWVEDSTVHIPCGECLAKEPKPVIFR
jgi:hypothetical protein